MERTARPQSPLHRTDARSKLLVTVVFLVTMLSVPLCRLPELLLFFVFPIVACAMGGLELRNDFGGRSSCCPSSSSVYRRFQPVLRPRAEPYRGRWRSPQVVCSFSLDRTARIRCRRRRCSAIGSTGYYGLCRSMQRLGAGCFHHAAAFRVHRYLYVLIEEAAAMQQARDEEFLGADPFYPAKEDLGEARRQLLIRHLRPSRADQPGDAGTGIFAHPRGGVRTRPAWKMRDTLFLAVWCSAFVLLRLCRPAENLSMLINNL